MKNVMRRALAVILSLAMVLTIVNIPASQVQAATKKPTKITLKTTYKTVDVGGTVTVSVKKVSPAGASKSVTYKSSNKKVATVTSKGVVTGKKAGTVTITATSKATSKVKATIKLTVKDIRPTSITVNKSTVTGYMGATATIKATVKPANSNQKVSYTSSDKDVVTVDSKGNISLVSLGEAKITVKAAQKNSKGKYVTKTVKVVVEDRANASIDWQSMTAAQVFAMQDAGKDVIVLDIRPEEIEGNLGYAAGHIKGSLWVPSWPVDSQDKQNVLLTYQVSEALSASNAPIVVVCRSGAGGAKRAISVLKDLGGIDVTRLYILKDGGKGLIEYYEERLEKGTGSFEGKYVISAKDLKAKMDANEAVKIVDTRGVDAKTTTVKGAITMVWQQISRTPLTDGTNPGEAGFARSLEATEMSAALSKLGLGFSDEIILVSDGHTVGGWGDDGRVLWQLLQCGYTNVKMLNGGVSAMKAVAGEEYLQLGASTPVEKAVTVKAVDQDTHSVSTEKLLEWYKNGEAMKVVDVRANAEYNGAVLYGETSGGHLKDALHIRFTDLFKADGTLKPVAELTAMFEEAGLSKTDKIVTYCTGGIRSAYMQLVLEMCGFTNSFNYAESAYRWCNTASAGTADYFTTETATKWDLLTYVNDNNDNTVVIDARLADVYSGWAVDGNKVGGHIKDAANVSAQWLTCSYSSNAKENKSRDEAIKLELDAQNITTDKKYIVYDTNGKDAAKVAEYLTGKGYSNVRTYNAKTLIESGNVELSSYANYDLWVPAEVVKNISDHLVNLTALSAQASKIVDGKDIVLLDVSWGDEKESGYLDGHVPGAVHVNTDDYETPAVYIDEKAEDYKWEWRLNSDEKLLKLAADKGITKDSCVIITGYEPMATTRMAIILKYLGCDNVHVMSEALVGWDAQGYAYQKENVKPGAVASFGVDTPQNPDLIDTIAEAKEKLGTAQYQLIDTRTIEEWNGTSTGYGYHDLAGRIAGTIHSESGIGYSSSMYYYRNPDMSMRSQAALESMWKTQGIDTGKHMAFFCGSGWRAAEETWDAMALGYTDVSLYSDGWIGWSNEGNPYLDKDGNTVHYDKTTNSVVPVQ